MLRHLKHVTTTIYNPESMFILFMKEKSCSQLQCKRNNLRVLNLHKKNSLFVHPPSINKHWTCFQPFLGIEKTAEN